MAFLASKCGEGEDEVLSLHGGLTLNIQKQLEINFRQLITGRITDSNSKILRFLADYPPDIQKFEIWGVFQLENGQIRSPFSLSQKVRAITGLVPTLQLR